MSIAAHAGARGASHSQVDRLGGGGIAQGVVAIGTVKGIGSGASDKVIAVARTTDHFDATEGIASGNTGVNAGFQVDRHTYTRDDVLITDGVDTCATNQLISACTTDQQVIARSTGDDVVPGVATTGEVGRTGVGQALDFGAHSHAGLIGTNLVVATACQLNDSQRAGTVDDVDVVAGAAIEGDVAGGHGKDIIVGRAGDHLHVAEHVTLGIAACTGACAICHRHVDRLGRAGVAHGVVAIGAIKGIGRGATDKVVAVGRTTDHFDAIECVAHGQAGMDTGFQVDGDTRPRIVVFVTGGVDARATHQLVGPRTADEEIVTISTVQNIVACQTAYLIIASSTQQRICSIGPVNYRHYIFLVCVGKLL
ncbi:hypothetical protein C5612_23990 [Pseudomonas frederiksbergensis]|uniref:Uncharacterized protein n=1 Tax=Pseudomonas frederiksbergensis TaxID=104087 RepID=A0A2S8HBZ6_9PSED|nr:hypothetical protein C5612_23990 [Pseudomonas frederiksbergensis]